MHAITHMEDQAIQGTEGWKLEALLNQMLNRHIDQVGWIAHGVSSLLGGLLDKTAPPSL